MWQPQSSNKKPKSAKYQSFQDFWHTSAMARAESKTKEPKRKKADLKAFWHTSLDAILVN